MNNKTRHIGSNLFVVLLALSPLLPVFDGQLEAHGLPASSRWRARLCSPPVIENCVYQETQVWHNGEKDLYQFRWQPNAFLFRQLRSLSEASSNYISCAPSYVCYVGRFNDDAWSINWTQDPYGTLYLFPHAGISWDAPPKNPGEFEVYIGNSELLTTLCYGIDVAPATVQWLDESNFTGISLNNGKVEMGEIIGSADGLPATLKYHLAGYKPGFIEKYKYAGAGLDLRDFPSEIDTYTYDGDKTNLVDIKRILILKTSFAPLPERFFDSKTYFVAAPPSFARPEPDMIMLTNGQELAMKYGVHGGRFQPLLSLSEARRLGGIGPTANHATHKGFANVLFWGLILVSIWPFWLLWKYLKKQLRIPINSDTDSKIFGQHSGIFGQLSERSDAPQTLLRGCPNWVKFFPFSGVLFFGAEGDGFPPMN